LQDIST